jgi:hypothetical protein
MRRISMGTAVLAALLAAMPVLAQGPGGGEPPSVPKLGGPGPTPTPTPEPTPAPPPAPAEPSLEQKLKDFVVGRWVNVYVDAVGNNITADYRLAADGTATGSHTNTTAYGRLKYNFKGKWTLFPTDETSFDLRFEMNGDMLIRSTEEVKILDANTLENSTTMSQMKRTP